MGVFREEARTGWRNLAGCAIGTGFGVGCYPPVSSLFFRALETQFGWSKSAAVASLIALPLTGLLLPAIGALVDHLGVRLVASLSVCCFGASLFGLSFLQGRLLTFYILFLTLNLLGAGTGPVGYTRPVVASFKRSRGIALSLALVGTGISSVFLPALFGPMLAAGDWRMGYRVFAGIALVAGGAACLLIRKESAPTVAEKATLGIDFTTALSSRSFWTLAISVLFVNAATVGLLTQFQSVMAEGGLSLVQSARLIPLLSISVVLSRLLVGRALDMASPYRVAASSIALAALGASLLLFRNSHALFISIVATLLIGISFGAEIDILSYICARSFGLRRYSSIYGALYLFFNLGIAAGGLAYGQVHDRTGTYHAALMMTIVLLFLSSGMFLSLLRSDRKLLRAMSDPLLNGSAIGTP